MAEVDWDRLQKFYEMSDEDLERVKASPKLRKVMDAGPRIVRSRMICEVVSSQYCSHGIKPGQHYVLSPHGNVFADQCTAPLCVYMIAPLLMPMRVVHDRICEGVDPNGLVWDQVRCLDTGLNCGGLGEVSMRIRVEERGRKEG